MRAMFGGMNVSEARRLKQLEDENKRLKRLVAEQARDIQMLRGRLKKLKRAEQRCNAARQLIVRHGIWERRACRLLWVTRKTFRRKPAEDRNMALLARLRELADQGRRDRTSTGRWIALPTRSGTVVASKH